MSATPWPQRACQAGISTIEILVGVALGLVLIAGLGSMVVGSRQTGRVERNLLEMQNIGRTSLDVIAREVRKAGYRTNRDQTLADLFPVAAAPFDKAGAVVAVPSTGGLMVRYEGSGDAWTSDCLGNVIANGNDVWQTLWVESTELRCRTRNLTTNTDQTLALAPQVEAMALSFGIDNDADGFADAYAASAGVADWSRVVSVIVQLRVLSSEDGLADAAQPFVSFNGTVVTPTDQRLRRSYSSVVALRNLLP